MISTSFIIQNQSQVLQRRKGIVYQLGFLTRGVKRSVYLLVNQLRNPRSFSAHPAHILLCILSLLLAFQRFHSRLFSFFSVRRYNTATWQVHFFFARRSRCLSSTWMLMSVLKYCGYQVWFCALTAPQKKLCKLRQRCNWHSVSLPGLFWILFNYCVGFLLSL